MITIREIAQEAGVAISTVSNVLNHPRTSTKASEKTRQRILNIAAKYHYTPCSLGKNLRKGKSYTIAALGRMAFYDAQTASALDGAEETFRNAGYSLLFISTREGENLSDCIARLFSRRVDGVLLIEKLNAENREVFQKVAKELPTVKVFANAGIENILSVFVDVVSIGNLAADCFLRYGHRKIMVLGDRPGCRDVFLQRMADSGIRIPQEYIFPQYESFDAGRKVVALIAEHNLEVTGIFCYNDTNAAGVIYEAAKRGIKIPGELSVLGIGNIDIARQIYPMLTTIELPQRKQGIAAAQTLLRMISEKASTSGEILYPTLIERDSMGQSPDTREHTV
ncbi:MAG TPA: LacI family transcriptional regulator [Victivallis vadensis]|nr:LacI family transcriptional regulator [Victivallis vadensis]